MGTVRTTATTLAGWSAVATLVRAAFRWARAGSGV